MEQPKIVTYVRFSVDTDQEEVDRIKDEMDVFVGMIEAKVMKQHWEILSKDCESGIFNVLQISVKEDKTGYKVEEWNNLK